MADAPGTSVATGSLDDARLAVRFAAYCVLCDLIVARAEDGSCPNGHPADALTGRIVLFADDEMPRLPRFNLAAFLVPFAWGPAHGQWVGLFFLPIWVFADGIASSAGRGGPAGIAGAAAVLVLTLTFQSFFAKRANGLAFRRVIDTTPAEKFMRNQLTWAVASVPFAAALLAVLAWSHLAGPLAVR